MLLLIKGRLLWFICYVDVDQIETSGIATATVSVICLSRAAITCVDLCSLVCHSLNTGASQLHVCIFKVESN